MSAISPGCVGCHPRFSCVFLLEAAMSIAAKCANLYGQIIRPKRPWGLSGSQPEGFLERMNAQIQIFFLMIAGWVNRHQQAIIEYFQEENRILLEQLGGKPRRFTEVQRIRLACKARPIGRRKLLALG